MCGIVGYAGTAAALPRLLEGLEHLEYRGYDSAGITVTTSRGPETVRTIGPLASLHEHVRQTDEQWAQATVGIGHTRWATHGEVSVANAHPVTDQAEDYFVVLNGIIENYHDLKQICLASGDQFSSATDAEVVAHLIAAADEGDLAMAVQQTLPSLVGNFAFVVMSRHHPGLLVATRREAPLVLGQADDGVYIGSAVAAFLAHTRRVIYLADDEVVAITADDIRCWNASHIEQPCQTVTVDWSETVAEKDGYETFMAKEMAEQPRAIADTMAGRLFSDHVDLRELQSLADREWARITIVACGTSYNAGLLARPLLRRCVGQPITIALASEWRYDDLEINADDLVIGITQSGETADTLAALRRARQAGATVMVVTNIAHSQATREAELTLLTRAHLEVGVAATKTFVAQTAALWLLAIYLGRDRLRPEDAQILIDQLHELPRAVQQTLDSNIQAIEDIAERWAGDTFFLYISRLAGIAAALEGALKLKEIAYVATDAYAAGEMKHGPIALLTSTTPVIGIATDSPVFDKMVSNLAEVKARGAETLVITGATAPDLDDVADFQVRLPSAAPWLQPLLAIIPLQRLAYAIAQQRGLNVDQPRNLAKTVTVE